MAAQCETPSNDYWDDEFDLGTSSTWRFEGTNGLARLSGPEAYTADQPDRFGARLTRVQIDHVALEAFRAAPHVAQRGPAQIRTHPTPTLTFVVVVDGTAHVETEHHEFDLDAGDCLVVDSRNPLTWRWSTETALLRSVVGIEHIPVELRLDDATLPRPLKRTALIDSFIAFISSILTSTASGRQARGDPLIRAVADLQVAVLAEAQHLMLQEDGPAGLRHRMEQYIELHYTDPDLTPAGIADAFGISLRRAHLVFNDDERTIARFIRDRRVSAAARELRSAHAPLVIQDIARRYGFRDRNTLDRAFQQRFAMTPTEYQNGGHRHLG